MKPKKSLNRKREIKRRMEENEKEILKALRFFMRHNRAKVVYIRDLDKKLPINDVIEKRLLDLDYINYNDHMETYHWQPDYYITQEGYNKFCELRNINYDYWRQKLTIANLIMFIANLYLLSRSLGLWK